MTLAGVGVTDIWEAARAAVVTGMLGLLLKFYLENRKLKLQERGDDRDGYGALILALQEDAKESRDHRRECERRLTDVEAQLRGVHRQLVMQSSSGAIALGQPSGDVMDAAKRAMRIVEDGDGKGDGDD